MKARQHAQSEAGLFSLPSGFLRPVFFGAQAAFFAAPDLDAAGPPASAFVSKKAAMKRHMSKRKHPGISA